MTRVESLAELSAGPPFDALVVGGGITGSGIALECARAGLRTALVEARDFAWGTSSRSSRLVHGGLRYLAQGDFRLTREAVRDRTELLRAAPGLVNPLGFLLPVRAGDKYGRFVLGLGLAAYDVFAGMRTRKWHNVESLLQCAPILSPAGLKGGWSYLDAQTDDARLVFRVLAEARRLGAVAINRLEVEALTVGPNGVDGVRVSDVPGGEKFEVKARCVFNAAGVWGDRLRGSVGGTPKLRPLRGSHLLFDAWRLPLAQAIAFFHPDDRRPIFAIPWEGSTLLGTTDVDDRGDLDREPGITRTELDYLLRAAGSEFPSLGLGEADVVASWSGVRPVIASGSNVDPSKEKRDSLILNENGLITVTGGKLTTFRSTAIAALAKAAEAMSGFKAPGARLSLFAPPSATTLAVLDDLPADLRERWVARYGDAAAAVKACAAPGDLQTIRHTGTTFAELRWACRSEDVVHLDDLLLRRTRLGLLLRNGAEELLPKVQTIACGELGWSDARWIEEVAAYRLLIARCYAIPQAQP
jgi:glycerol-3-phosphate dehydrogenase